MGKRLYFPQIKVLQSKLSIDLLFLIDNHLKEINGWNDVNLSQVCKEGRIEIVRYINENYPQEHEGIYAIDEAAEYGYLNIIKYLHHNNPGNFNLSSTNAVDKAAQKGHLDVVKWLIQNRNH